MPRYCFVPGCFSSHYPKSRKPDGKIVSFFKAPKDPVLRKRWHIASRRADREMNEKDSMCELHFEEDCIERYFTTELYDGEVFKLERGRFRLKKGSVPTIFPFSKPVKKKERQTKNSKGSNNFVLGETSLSSKFSRQPSKLTCAAYGCGNSSDKNIPGISFHRFPINEARKKKWIDAVCGLNFQPSEESVLCSAHFTPDQIVRTNSPAALKYGAVPSIFTFDEGPQTDRLPANLDANFYDSQDFDRYSSFSADINDIADQDSNHSVVPDFGTSCFKEENDETAPKVPSSNQNRPSQYFNSGSQIVEGYEEVFGKFVANELKILSCYPPLYSRTKEKIWRVLNRLDK